MRCVSLIGFLLLLAGCVHRAADTRRPVVHVIPYSRDQLAAIGKDFPEVEKKTFIRSLRLSRSAQDSFSIHGYNSWLAFIDIQNLVKAINLVPKNPFAWTQLGAYLALDHQTGAAILATQRALDIVGPRCDAGTCAPELRRLEMIAGINLAIYQSDEEHPLDALIALRKIKSVDLSAAERLPYCWTETSVRSSLGDIDGARRALTDAADVAEADLAAVYGLQVDYPQYFGEQREGIQRYLTAVTDMAAGDLSGAESSAHAAINRYPRLWDAHLLLANIEYARKDYDATIRTLEEIKEQKAPPGEIFRSERIDYNLGNAHVARFDETGDLCDLEAAKSLFENAARIVENRFGENQAQAGKANAFNSHEVARFYLDAIATTPPIYADACNNLGTVLSQIAEQSNDERERRKLDREAEVQFHEALRDQSWPRRQLAYANLAQLYAREARISEAAEAADAALDLDALNAVPLRALVDVSATHPDLGVAAQAAYVVGRLIAQHRLQYPQGTFNAMLSPAESRLRAGAQTVDVRKALFLLDYATAPKERTVTIVEDAHAAVPGWSWPSIEIARSTFKEPHKRASVEKLLRETLDRKIPADDWIARREMGDALLLRAAIRFGDDDFRGARRDIERAMAAGVSRMSIEDLRVEIDSALENKTKPTNIKEWIALQSRAKKGAIAGAIIGGLLGAANARITGAQSDDVWKQALAGAVVGAIADFAIGKHNDHIHAGRELAVQETHYDSSQGYFAHVEEVRFDPANAQPGETATLYVRYVVLGPDPNEAIKIRMFRGLKYGDEYIFGAGPNEFVIPKGGGIVESTMQVTLPKTAPEGTYAIEALVEDSKGRFPQVVGTGVLYIIAQLPPRGGVITTAR